MTRYGDLCYVCRYYGDRIAKVLSEPAEWQLVVGQRAKLKGHWTVHSELEHMYNVLEADVSTLDLFLYPKNRTVEA